MCILHLGSTNSTFTRWANYVDKDNVAYNIAVAKL